MSPEQLQPASRRELLAALLGELRDAHWAAAAGCSASPAAMVPLVVDTALANKVRAGLGWGRGPNGLGGTVDDGAGQQVAAAAVGLEAQQCAGREGTKWRQHWCL